MINKAINKRIDLFSGYGIATPEPGSRSSPP
jgi:hypothetical protein